MTLTTPYPTASDGNPITAATWNNANCYRLLHAESYDYNDTGSDYFKEYSYTADTATTGVMVLATGYMQLHNANTGTLTIAVDSVVKATQNLKMNANVGDIWKGYNNSIWCVLTNSDMTVAANHIIRVELSSGETGTMKITGLLIYAF